jgi:hypothetical protein
VACPFHSENSDQSPKETMPALELWRPSCANSPPRGVFESESSPANAAKTRDFSKRVNARFRELKVDATQCESGITPAAVSQSPAGVARSPVKPTRELQTPAGVSQSPAGVVRSPVKPTRELLLSCRSFAKSCRSCAKSCETDAGVALCPVKPTGHLQNVCAAQFYVHRCSIITTVAQRYSCDIIHLLYMISKQLRVATCFMSIMRQHLKQHR